MFIGELGPYIHPTLLNLWCQRVF